MLDASRVRNKRTPPDAFHHAWMEHYPGGSRSTPTVTPCIFRVRGCG